jgi:lipid II:glycine glycyltransferase (peptidoglycan interpeptide bridge formation enzyme)
MIELNHSLLFLKNKIIYYSDDIFDVKHYDSVTFRAIKNEFNDPTFNHREEICYVLDLTPNLDSLWGQMNRNVHRNIKRAEQTGIEIKFNQGYEEFYQMYQDHLNVKKHIRWFNVHKLDDIKKYGTLVVAEKDDKMISGSVFLEDENYLVYWITASYRYSDDKLTKQLAGNATHLIQWEIIKYAKSKGLKEYNLGGCATNDLKNELLVQFKESLGGKPVKYYIFCENFEEVLSRTVLK